MKKIILTVLSATFLLASHTMNTNNTEEKTSKSRDAILAEKQALRAANIEAKLAKKELARVAKTKLREEKIHKVDEELKAKAIQRAQA